MLRARAARGDELRRLRYGRQLGRDGEHRVPRTLEDREIHFPRVLVILDEKDCRWVSPPVRGAHGLSVRTRCVRSYGFPDAPARGARPCPIANRGLATRRSHRAAAPERCVRSLPTSSSPTWFSAGTTHSHCLTKSAARRVTSHSSPCRRGISMPPSSSWPALPPTSASRSTTTSSSTRSWRFCGGGSGSGTLHGLAREWTVERR
jgi:hypothetical protein